MRWYARILCRRNFPFKDQFPGFGWSDGTASPSEELQRKRLPIWTFAEVVTRRNMRILAGYCNSGETDALLYAVTRSAEINQELLPKPCFGWARKIAKQFDAALLVAHSGTFMAFAIPRDEGGLDRLLRLQEMLRCQGFGSLFFPNPEVGGDNASSGIYSATSPQLFQD